YDEFPRVKTSFGINIVSTSKGIMSSVKASRERIGGEIICQVW
ncbi:MAG: 30S ribosomal protein S8, partial [Elusimicrobiales bacterium]